MASHCPNQCWNIVNWTLSNKLPWKFNWNSHIFIQENAFQKVFCRMAANLSHPQCIKPSSTTMLVCMIYAQNEPIRWHSLVTVYHASWWSWNYWLQCHLNIRYYSIHVPGWLQKWLNLITAPGSVSNEPGSVTWLATKYLKTVSWRNHTEKLTTWWPQNIAFWPKINIPSSYFTILMLHCLKNTLKLQFDSYVTAVRFLT